MRIKKTKDNNQYLLTKQKMWVRDFTKNDVPFVDLNKTYKEEDYFVFLENETQNCLGKYSWIDTESFIHEKIVILSDGYNFSKKQEILKSLPKDVTIIGVNNSLNKWKIPERTINYYLVNNPYEECMKYFPRRNKNLPKCISSNRTNYKFLRNYKGVIYKYCPTNESTYTNNSTKEISYKIDDYRNTICAAIQIAYRFYVEKLLLFCCDDSFAEERPGAEKLYNNLWQYPQQNLAHQLIDSSLYWLKNSAYNEIKIANHSSGALYENAAYINEEEIIDYFT